MVCTECNKPKQLADARPGDHLCALCCNTSEEEKRVVPPFILRGLELNERVCYIADEGGDGSAADRLLVYLRETGLDVEQKMKSGQLVCAKSGDVYTKGGVFDPQKTTDVMLGMAMGTLKEGWTALRIAADMSWALRGVSGTEHLVEYESVINKAILGKPVVGMCIYNTELFDASVLTSMLHTHPLASVGGVPDLLENIFYFPPDDFLVPKEEFPKQLLRQAINNLRGHHQLACGMHECKHKLEDAVRRQETLLAVTSHELRTPLNSIVGYANLCVEPIDHSELARHLSQVQDSARQLLTTVNDLGDLFQADLGKLQPSIAPFSLSTVLENVRLKAAELLANKAASGSGSDVELRVALDQAIVPMVEGDESRVLQILDRLVTSAIGHTESGFVECCASLECAPARVTSATTTSATATGTTLRLTVRDTGTGLSDLTRQKLMQRLEQPDLIWHANGRGLGLVLCRELASVLGGRLLVESERGHGTTVCVDLPYRPVTASPSSAPTTSVSPLPPTFAAPPTSSAVPVFFTVRSACTVAAACASVPVAAQAPAIFSSAVSSSGSAASDMFSPSTCQPRVSLAPAPPPPAPPPPAPPPIAPLPPLPPVPPPPPAPVPTVSVSVCAPSAHVASASSLTNFSPANHRVLVVDDDQPSLKLVCRMLSRAGYAVETAEDGQQAVDKYQALMKAGSAAAAGPGVSLVLMDMQMPVMSGTEATQAIRRMQAVSCGHLCHCPKARGPLATDKPCDECRRAHVPIVFLSGQTSPDMVQVALESGADAYLTKPAGRSDLLATVEKFIRHT